ncbi:MAG: RsiV family protein [Bacteroidales bacterium]|nr:RsiV family protein [Bacteroidales bacterium]MCM1147771.1 RsiV family protein [Bacteroidales bacterium]MCM1206619.1 RsiV family protein [Bacillota bacterium]MCM1510640.1 RsiV family protein [Clostridium sp.]
MKRHRLIILSAALLVMIAAVSCRSGKTVTATAPVPVSGTEETLAFDSVEWHDSAVVRPNGITRVDYKCVYPVKGNKALTDSIMRWIREQYGDSACNGTADMRTVLEKSGRKTVAADKAELAEILSYREGGDGFPMEYATDIRTFVEYESADYVTLLCQTYTYRAGAHGLTVNNAVTFSVKDGSRCGWSLLQGMTKKEITDKIKTGLAEYFRQADSDFGGNLRDMLLGVSEADYENNFPLPAFPPYLTKNGVTVLYQQYEIAPYAAGMPNCVIKP